MARQRDRLTWRWERTLTLSRLKMCANARSVARMARDVAEVERMDRVIDRLLDRLLELTPAEKKGKAA